MALSFHGVASGLEKWLEKKSVGGLRQREPIEFQRALNLLAAELKTAWIFVNPKAHFLRDWIA